MHQSPSNDHIHNAIMDEDGVEVKNNKSLMWYDHLMVVVNKIWSTSDRTASLEKWNRLTGKVMKPPKKVSLTPKKVKLGPQKKSISPIPSEHGHFAKNRIKIG